MPVAASSAARLRSWRTDPPAESFWLARSVSSFLRQSLIHVSESATSFAGG